MHWLAAQKLLAALSPLAELAPINIQTRQNMNFFAKLCYTYTNTIQLQYH